MNRNDVLEYLAASRRIDGWLFSVDALVFGAIDQDQKSNGITGNLFEIGVHHGKTAILLDGMRTEGESSGFCDLFGRQDLNVDASGKGDRAIFERNFTHHRGHAPVRVFEMSSHDLGVAETTASCRFFHIDGGHRAQDVLNDLEVADRALIKQGIVAVDDVFNPSWPGVSEGFHEFMKARPETFSPLVIGGNKVFLCRPAAWESYSKSLSPDSIQKFVSQPTYSFQLKDWYGRRVASAVRLAWLDLQPLAAIRLRLTGGGWRDCVAQVMGRN